MGSEVHHDYSQLNIFFFPFMAHGHMIPTLDMAKLFATHGAKTSIITTPLNLPFFSKSIERFSKQTGLEIGVKLLNFPSVEVGLPSGCENADSLPAGEPLIVNKFFAAAGMLKDPLERLLQEFKPDCLIADMFFPWTTDAAAKFDIPRLVFHGTSFFALSASECIRLYTPFNNVSSDSEPFLVPTLPDEIRLTRNQLADFAMKEGDENGIHRLIKEAKESELKSYGVVVNSFYELEPAYADHYRNFLKRKAWHIGPVSLCNKTVEDKAERGKRASIDEDECLKWLNSKAPNSVIYICFGSMANFNSAQLMEIATALDASGQEFIWVVRREKNENNQEDWLPEGFEQRTEGKGLIIRGWAPQVLILEHEAVGGFVTHCGWNSTLEGVTAGMPMVTWPVSAEQFYNEKLVTEVLKIGLSVGVKKWVRSEGDFVSREKVEQAVREIMVGSEAVERRMRAKAMADMARAAVEKGGSSYNDLNALLREVSLMRRQQSQNQ